MSDKFDEHLKDWLEENSPIDSSNQFVKIINLIGFLKDKGYAKKTALNYGLIICESLSDKELLESILNCQQLIVAHEIKLAIDIVYRDVAIEECSDSNEITESKDYENNIIETEEHLSINMSVADLNLQIEEDTSFLDSIRVGKNE